ncbi:DNA primase DnaG [Haloarcula onubensis]|uniref:DNA primase DnaG n=1 Tax=Haloarcula onubensis TaxID=2950539 RepID=A0ABU2FS37_9EURY|nr:DNA primase DnaG [Halomicroarcula sp. S3CR25-11]MDS0283570.1 DNA primase DnaG [Halomicroarcula sp. S3CR25-11]
MDETAKYLIHAEITAAGVVERSDVVGAVFGQTEGLLGDELDLRDLQDSKKVGRIDVEIRSDEGTSSGEITVGSGLDKVETAILAAALETIDQVGPCSAEIVVTDIEDIRSAKRRAVVERATELLASFDADAVQSEDIVETVRQRARVEDITTYEGLPAGPRVADSDAIVVVEGRADVLQLLKYGVKNAIAVEGTDVPEAVAALTRDRTVTAFLDGDRGGDLILEELSQVGEVDFVAVAPRGRSVEDLPRGAVMAALREKIPYETVAEAESPEAVLDADGAGPESVALQPGSGEGDAAAAVAGVDADATAGATSGGHPETASDDTTTQEAVAGRDADAETATDGPTTLSDHIDATIGADTATVRLLDPELSVLAEGDAADAVSLIEGCDPAPRTVVLDDTCSQKVLDVAAQRGVEVVVATGDGEYVKQPTSVQVRTV